MEPFTIQYRSGSFTFTFKAELIETTKQLETWRLTGGAKVVTLQSNRPILLARGLKKKAIHWKVLEGKVNNVRALEEVTKLIERKLKGEDITPKPERSRYSQTPFQIKSKPPWREMKRDSPTLGERNAGHIE
jgi:6-phosphogluconolactonase/glucosamine-6-phosphate isomerase/deaminase